MLIAWTGIFPQQKVMYHQAVHGGRLYSFIPSSTCSSAQTNNRHTETTLFTYLKEQRVILVHMRFTILVKL